ncbi:MAG: hypothetical protein GY799_05385 [Desulfobulbaceae bacterium]|nr:hypothetical protein [Desulfobulbaceae bacterium]
MSNNHKYWNRFEPRPRNEDISRSLEAQVRDPMWFLTRQFQLGEFQGEDAASPFFVELVGRTSPLNAWRSCGETTEQVLDSGAPLEAQVENEPFSPDLAMAVELGQKFETLLRTNGKHELVDIYRQKYPLSKSSEPNDPQAARFINICAGRAINGLELLKAVPVLLKSETKIVDILRTFSDWVAKVYGLTLSKEDARSWQPAQLEYRLEVSATTPDFSGVRFDAYPGREGQFDWYAFDQKAQDPKGSSPHTVEKFSRSMQPMKVQFNGMPNARWWKFEHGRVNLCAVDTDLRELAKLALTDFMLIQSNDWYVVPFTQAVGTLCKLDTMQVYDVFGGKTFVDRADNNLINPSEGNDLPDQNNCWSMFSTSLKGTDPQNREVAEFFILPPSAYNATMNSDPIEEIRFMRDEMANLVWAIEHTTENGIGEPWPGHERAVAAVTEETTHKSAAPLIYRIQNNVPEHWIPFIPVRIPGTTREIALERAAMLNQEEEEIKPHGRILDPDSLEVYRVREEEVTRVGTRISRVVRRSRWTDGSTHLWIARRKRAGAGEGNSGLRYDIAVDNNS